MAGVVAIWIYNGKTKVMTIVNCFIQGTRWPIYKLICLNSNMHVPKLYIQTYIAYSTNT